MCYEDGVEVRFWSPKSDLEFENGPCGGKCSATLSMGNGGDLLGDGQYSVPWECQHGYWLMAAERPVATSVVCSGLTDEQRLAAGQTLSWGDELYLEDLLAEAAMTPEQRAGIAAFWVERERLDAEAVIQIKVHRKEEKWTDRSGSMKFRVPRPCKYASLFAKRMCASCFTHIPKGCDVCPAQIVKEEGEETRHDGRKVGSGKMITRLAKEGDKNIRTCGEKLAGCWSHERKRDCIYVHPDEPQWAAACAGTLRVKEDNRLVFCMVGEERPAMRNFGGMNQGKTQGKPQGKPNAFTKRN